MRLKTVALICAALAWGWTFQSLAAQDKPVHSSAGTRKLAHLPGLPTCSSQFVESGDPSKGGSIIFAKSEPGCTVPWHWHTPIEKLMIVSGRVNIAMRDGDPAALRPGDFLALPSKHVHQFTCVTGCTLFIASDAAFDIHYVDASGKEISTEEALKAKAKPESKK